MIARGELAGETEMWAVAGDLPDICFETIDAPTPADALRFYCAVAWDWGQAALGRHHDISESYPLLWSRAASTRRCCSDA